MRVRVIGELDMSTAPALQEALLCELDAGGSEVLVDLAEVPFIDSSGLQAIVKAARKASSVGGTLAVALPLPEQARRVIEITGLATLLHVA